MSAHVFALLKWDNWNVEIASEYAKDKVWENSTHVLENQEYVFGKQYKRIKQLDGQVQIILTDGPLLHSLIYADQDDYMLKSLVMDRYRQFNNFDIFVERDKKYNPAGRSQTLDEAKALDEEIKGTLLKHDVDLRYIKGRADDAKFISEKIKQRYWLLAPSQG